MTDDRTRCCCGGCPIRGGSTAAAIFLIASSAIILFWSIYGIINRDRVSAYGGTIAFTGLMILAASLSLWGLNTRQYWPCVFVIMLLSFGLIGVKFHAIAMMMLILLLSIGCAGWAAYSGILIAALGDCSDKQKFRQLTDLSFRDSDGSIRRLSEGEADTVCDVTRAIAITILAVSVTLLVLYVWFIQVFSKAIGYIRYLRMAESPTVVGITKTASAVQK